ncbi:MAG TPA: PEP-CTERM sorting domain-containing protein [Candidatus Eisenbacteria bacterium]|nr:PEP-CTERM sorting domain-containing protein [Candidatus Eisenbacteria bacterium]
MAPESGNTKSPSKLLVLLAFTLLLPCAQASILGNGLSTPPSPLFPTGSLVAAASGTITAPTFTTTYQQAVLSDPLNTWCAGCLDFVYQFTVLGPDPNQRFSMSSFQGLLLDVGTNPFGAHDPTLVDRSVMGAIVGFNFPASDEIAVGSSTVELIIETNARYLTTGFVSAQDGTAGSGVAWAPSAIPEPASLVLMGSGLIAVGKFLRKSRVRG